MRAAGVRWTDEDLTNFKRNSGRGLPKPTLQHMANATGKAVDKDGEAIPATNQELAARAAVKETKRRMEPAKKRKANYLTAKRPRGVAMTATEAQLRGIPAPEHIAGKYRNTKRVRDGIRFDSILEADKYTELEFQRKARAIDYFLRQVPIHLPGGVILRVDFVTYKCVEQSSGGRQFWEVHYIDTKGHQTRESKNKIKQAKHEYGIEVELVKKVRKLRS